MNSDSKLIFEAYALKGLAHGKNEADIAKKHGVELGAIKSQIEKGIKIEHEHTKDEKTAKKIAMDHVFEDPEYYDKLNKIEAKSEDAEHPIIKTKKELAGNIMSIVKYGIPDESEIPEIKQKLTNIFINIKKAGGHVSENQSKEAKHYIGQLRNAGMEEGELRDIYRNARPQGENQEAHAYASAESNEDKSEEAEMPVSDFNKLKHHINKGPISIKKKDTKEVPYTHAYMRDLAKQDPREGQKEENAEGNYSKVAHDYAERIVGAEVDDPKALAKHYLDNPDDVPEPLKHDVLKQNFDKILNYIDFTVNLNLNRKKEDEYKKKELARGPIQADPEVGLPGSKQARYKPRYKYNPADYLPRQ